LPACNWINRTCRWEQQQNQEKDEGINKSFHAVIVMIVIFGNYEMQSVFQSFLQINSQARH